MALALRGFFDPLAARELGSFSRRWQTYAVRVAYVGISAYAVWQFWREATAARESLFSVSDYATLGRDLFLRFTGLQFALIPLAAMAAASDLVSREARAGTLGLLLLTGLTPRQIAWSKWRAAAAYAGLLVLAGLPVVAIAVFLGAVGPWELAWSAALTASMASLAAALALRFSATCGSSGTAVALTLLSIAGASLALPVGCLPAILVGVPLHSWLHPGYAALSVTLWGTEPLHGWAWLGAVPVSVLCTWAVLRNAGRRIAERAVAVPRPAPESHDFETLGSYYSKLRAPGRKRLVIERGVWQERPLLWKELATRAAGRLALGWRIAVPIFLALFGAFCWGAGGGGQHLEFFYLPASVLLLLAVAGGSFLFVREREGRRWDLLLSTPARPAEIVAAKLASGLVAPESLVVLFLLGLGVLGWSAWAGIERTFLMGTVVLLFLGFAYLLASAASLRSRTPRGAFVFTTGVLSVSLVALPYLLSLPGGGGSAGVLEGLSPVTVLEALFRHERAGGFPDDAVRAFFVFAGLHAALAGLLWTLLVLGVRSAPERL